MNRGQRAAAEAERVVGRYSPAMSAFFSHIFARELRRQFHAVRLFGSLPDTGAAPLIVYANHPSWWDAAIFLWSSRALFAGRRCFSPIETAMLAHYPFFGRVGGFAVDSHRLSSAADFIAVGERVLKSGDILLVNGEGRFKDIRERPLEVALGIAHVAKRVPDAVLVPLAIEYSFWDERRPNALLHFGEPIRALDLVGSTHLTQTRLSAGLESAMDRLGEAAVTRNAASFTTLLAGQVGINIVYDLWRRARATARGQKFSPAHGGHP